MANSITKPVDNDTVDERSNYNMGKVASSVDSGIRRGVGPAEGRHPKRLKVKNLVRVIKHAAGPEFKPGPGGRLTGKRG